MKPSMSFAERALQSFFFSPRRAYGIAALRAMLSAALLVQAVMIAPDFLELYGPEGILQAEVAKAFRNTYLAVALSESQIRLVGLAYLSSLLFLFFGFHSRLAAAVSWLCHMCLVGGHFTTYGVDSFAHIFLFYLMVFPSGAEWSLDRWVGRVKGGSSALATFGLRTMQLHVSIIYVASGLEKSVGPQWQSGEVIWRSLMLPIYQQFDMSWIGGWPWLMTTLAWGTLVLEIGYPLFLWVPRLRPLGVVSILALHAGIAVFLGLVSFSSVMAILTFTLFGIGGNAFPVLTPRIARRKMRPAQLSGTTWTNGRQHPQVA